MFFECEIMTAFTKSISSKQTTLVYRSYDER
jgi:hypothetical protein